jgi:glycosyltransferase involved in cell wall biosynthesis
MTPVLSLIVALYFEEDCVETYVARVRQALDHEDLTYEIVFVDDGSQDRTIPLVEAMAAADPRIKLVQLSRNYGKEVAVTAGIEHARGDYLLMMDVDLQDPPDRIIDFYRKIQEGYDLVFGVRIQKADTLLNVIFSKLFWSLLNNMTGLKIPTGLAVMRIFNRKFADEFLRHTERIRFIEGIFISIGLRSTTMPVENHPRFAGTSKFNFKRRIKLAVNAILAFSNRPVELAVGLGLGMLGLSIIAAAFFLLRKLIFDIGLTGWTSIVLFILFMGGVQIVLLGIIGSYVGRIYHEVKGRPLYIVQQRLNIGAQE